MKSLPDTVSKQTTVYNTATSGNASIVTIAAVTDDQWVIDHITWSYATAPTGGALTIENNTTATNILAVDVTAAGPGQLMFGERGLVTPLGAKIVITLADGSAAKKLTVAYR